MKPRETFGITQIRDEWGGTMSPRERFNAQMHFKPFDRAFNMEFGYWAENFTEWEDFVRNGIKSHDAAHYFFGLDRIEGVAGTHNGPIPPIEQPEPVPDDKGFVYVIDGWGVGGKKPADGHSTITHYTDPMVKTPSDWKKLKERLRPDEPARLPDMKELRERLQGRDFPAGIGFGSMIGIPRNILTFEGLCFAVYDYPEMVEDMIETFCQISEFCLENILPGTDFDFAAGWEDICFNNGPIISPQFFKKWIVPRYKRLTSLLNKHGIDVIYTDTDGDVKPIIDVFLDGGINTLFPMEVASGTDPVEIRKKYGGNVLMMGGVDKMTLIKGKEAIKRCLNRLAPVVQEGGYIPHVDHRCPPDVTFDNYLYYLDLKRELFGSL